MVEGWPIMDLAEAVAILTLNVILPCELWLFIYKALAEYGSNTRGLVYLFIL